MKHIAFAVIAAAVLAVVGPHITPDHSQIEKTPSQSAAGTATAHTSMVRMRAGHVD